MIQSKIPSRFLKLKKMQHKLEEYSQDTTMHGIRNIVKTESLLIRIMWLICLIISTASCSYFIFLGLVNYLNFDIVTIIDTIYEHHSQFPTVSFCNKNGDLNNSEIIKCEFNQNDCSDYFEKFHDSSGKLCYRFNSGTNIHDKNVSILHATSAGSNYGLFLELNVSLATGYDYSQIVISFHNHSAKSPSLNNFGHLVKTGGLNIFEIERVFDEKLEAPFNDCYKDINGFILNKTLIEEFCQEIWLFSTRMYQTV